MVGQSMAFLRESEFEGMYESALGSDSEVEEDDNKTIAKGETKALSWLKNGFFIVLIICTISVSVASLVKLKGNEKEAFETNYFQQVARLTQELQSNARVQTIQAFAESITAHAIGNPTTNGATFPNVTLPDYEIQAGATADLAGMLSIILVPLINDTNRSEWEEYSVENQGWLEEGLEVQRNAATMRRKLQESAQPSNDASLRIPEQIHIGQGLNSVETGDGPFLPQWQIYPAVESPELVNSNILAHEGAKDAAMAVLNTEYAVVGRSFDLSDSNDTLAENIEASVALFVEKWDRVDEFMEDPVANLYWPLFDSFDGDTATLVGLVSFMVYWRIYFENVLSGDAVLDVVLKNTCDQVYSYRIDGPDVLYMGPGDRHDIKFNDLLVTMPEGIFQQEGVFAPPDTDGSCVYLVNVYPTQEFEDVYVTSTPAVATVILILVFLFTSSVFAIYDFLVERRQQVLMDAAIAANAIVSSMFPANVRDRLFNRGEVDDADEAVADLSRHSKAHDLTEEREVETDIVVPKSRPIADLFQNCTVLFADLVGFKTWSSGRAPIDVFVLLETIYGEFDKIAAKRSVFKVESIGDCYLAVTGLPHPQKDHAVVMSLFAHECMKNMKLLLVNKLRNSLSGDVSTLAVRFGIHSGPVTAGVLRGEKSRFQLFGDTVNTAARMESTGQKNKIQASQDTADVLVQSNKSHWLLKRPDSVQAKGKGTLVTYWVQPRAFRPGTDKKRADAMLAEVMARKAAAEEAKDGSDSERKKSIPGDNDGGSGDSSSRDAVAAATGDNSREQSNGSTTRVEVDDNNTGGAEQGTEALKNKSYGNPQDATIAVDNS